MAGEGDRGLPTWLLGSWTVQVQHAELAGAVPGVQRCERVLDGAFLLQRWTYDHPDLPDGMALLSATRCHYFDVRGVTRTFELEVRDGGLTMTRLDDAFAQRTSLTRRDADHVDGTGEVSRDGGRTWQHDVALAYRRR